METYSSIYLTNVHNSATEKDIFRALYSFGNGDDSIVFHYPNQNAWSIMKFNFEGDCAIDNIEMLNNGLIIPVSYSYTKINENYGGIPRRVSDTMFIQINYIEQFTSNNTLNILSEIRKEMKKTEELETHLAKEFESQTGAFSPLIQLNHYVENPLILDEVMFDYED
jgi:hypothetical protein